MSRERALYCRSLAGGLVGEGDEDVRVALAPSVSKPTATEQRDAGGPRRAVVAFALGL